MLLVSSTFWAFSVCIVDLLVTTGCALVGCFCLSCSYWAWDSSAIVKIKGAVCVHSGDGHPLFRALSKAGIPCAENKRWSVDRLCQSCDVLIYGWGLLLHVPPPGTSWSVSMHVQWVTLSNIIRLAFFQGDVVCWVFIHACLSGWRQPV